MDQTEAITEQEAEGSSLPDEGAIEAGAMDGQIRDGLNAAIDAVKAYQAEQGGQQAETEQPASDSKQAEPIRGAAMPAEKAKVIGMPSPKDEPWDIAKCTFFIGITLMPEDGDPAGRLVVIGTRDHGDGDILRSMRMKDPAVEIGQALSQLYADAAASIERRRAAKNASKTKPKPAATQAKAAAPSKAKPAPAAAAPTPPPAAEPAKPAQLAISFDDQPA